MLSSSVLLGMIGPNQVIIILVIVILLFGAKKIPELMKGVGRGIKEFKDATNGNSTETSKDNTTEKTN